MPRRLHVGTLVASMFTALAVATATQATPDEDALAAIEHDFAEMQITKDPVTIARVAAVMDPGFRFTDPASPDPGASREQTLGMVTTGKLVIQSMEFRPFTIRVFGSTAIVEGVNSGRATFGDADVGGSFAWVDVFEKRDGRWVWLFSQSGKVGDKLSDKEPCKRPPCPAVHAGFTVSR